MTTDQRLRVHNPIYNDPVVLSHARALLEGPGTTVIQADLRDGDHITGHPQFRELIDLDQPVALLFFSVLYTLPDDQEAAQAVTRLGKPMAPGSYLAISHPVSDLRPDVTARLARLYQQQTGAITGRPRPNVRTKAEVERFFTDWDLIDPGVVYLPQWRPDPHTPDVSAPVWSAGGVARKN